MPESNLTPEILAAALEGLEAQRARLDAHIAETKRLLGARPQQPTASPDIVRPKRKMSAAGRKRIAAATKKRWAEFHQKQAGAAKTAKEPAAATKPKRKMSAAGRERIAAATKKRWAEFHRNKAEAAAKARKPAAGKKAAVKKAAAEAAGQPVQEAASE
jgi:hypothetical protein